MSRCNAVPIGGAKKFLLAACIGAAFLGIVSCSSFPQPSATQAFTPAQRARLLAEQAQPQHEVPFNPPDFDKFAGYYKLVAPASFARVFRRGDHYYTQLIGQPAVELFPESSTEFFARVVPAQLSFVVDRHGKVTRVILHQNGLLRLWLRSTQADYDEFQARLTQRILNRQPSPGTEASLRRFIASWEDRGQPDYDDMEPALAELAREQAPRTAPIFQQLGPFESIAFERVSPQGVDIYRATFAHGSARFVIAPLDANGKVVARFWTHMP